MVSSQLYLCYSWEIDEHEIHHVFAVEFDAERHCRDCFLFSCHLFSFIFNQSCQLLKISDFLALSLKQLSIFGAFCDIGHLYFYWSACYYALSTRKEISSNNSFQHWAFPWRLWSNDYNGGKSQFVGEIGFVQNVLETKGRNEIGRVDIANHQEVSLLITWISLIKGMSWSISKEVRLELVCVLINLGCFSKV